MYFQDIQTPRSQFKRRDKFGLTRIFPINTECKNCHQKEWKNYTTFFPHAFRAKDCVELGGTRVIYSNYRTRNMTPTALSILEKKNPEISVEANVEFPIGKKLFHLVVNPGTSRCPTDFLAVDPGTGTNYEKRVNGARNSVGNSNRENGPTFLDFPVFPEIFQWDEPTKRVPFTAEPEIPEILTKWKAPQVTRLFWDQL